MRTPVALLVFNRRDLTELVFEKIADAKPLKLFIIADGPRKAASGEVEQCVATRSITESIDWDCEVFRNYSDSNLGCRKRVSSGLDWVFSQVDEAIILEDDCLPDQSFFPFCEELLDRYRGDERIMMITGNDFLRASEQRAYSYYFSRNPHIWGWATWRRAWRFFDVSMKLWPELRDTSLLFDVLRDETAVEKTRAEFDGAFGGSIDTWDYQWLLTLWAQHGLAIAPETNLVSNLGFRGDATHTRNTADWRANLPTTAINFPLRHPPHVLEDKTYFGKAPRNQSLGGAQSSRFYRRFIQHLKEGVLKEYFHFFKEG